MANSRAEEGAAVRHKDGLLGAERVRTARRCTGRGRPVRTNLESAPFEEVGTVTISAGVCSNEHTRAEQELFSTADEALYRAKQSGR